MGHWMARRTKRFWTDEEKQSICFQTPDLIWPINCQPPQQSQTGHSLLKFHTVFFFEQIDCHQGFGPCFGVLDVVQIGFHHRRHGLGKLVQPVLNFMDPAALMFGAGEYLVQSVPEAHGTVADGNLWGDGQTATPETHQQLAPTLRTFAQTKPEAEQLLFTFRRCPDNHRMHSVIIS